MAEKNKTAFNEISSKLKELIKKTVAAHKFLVPIQLTIGKVMPIPVKEGQFQNKMVYPASWCFPERDIIIDEGEMKDIGAIERFDDLGVPVFGTLRFDSEEDGFKVLDYRNPKEKIFIDLIICSNFGNINPDREMGKEVCKIVDKLADSRVKFQKMGVLQAAINLAMEMEDSDVVDFAAAMDWNEREDIEILRPMVVELASAQPDFFKEFIESNGVELRSLLKKAITAGVVIYNSGTNELAWKNNEVFAVLKSEKGVTHLTQFISWVSAHVKGMETVELIRSLMGNGKGKKTAPAKPVVPKVPASSADTTPPIIPPTGELEL